MIESNFWLVVYVHTYVFEFNITLDFNSIMYQASTYLFLLVPKVNPERYSMSKNSNFDPTLCLNK